MKPTMEILERIKKNSEENKDEVFTRIYRYLLRPDIYFVAYQNLYSNNGASTKGVDDDTADGFSEAKIERIIKCLEDESYQPKPFRRVYIKKPNGKMRPLGIPSFTDKLVQEAVRIILEAIYEPIFMDTSHGFRPNRSCHTALQSVKYEFRGARWFIEGDIKGCFDNINHNVLVSCINKKIKDARFTKLIYKFLKAGFVDDFVYNNTYSGCAQGGIISPILANIYLHELDKFVENLSKEFNEPATEKFTADYRKAQNAMAVTRKKIKKAENADDEVEKAELLKVYKSQRATLLKTPCKSQTDKKLKYVRYADDFIIGVNGSKVDCVRIKQQLSDFISNTLKMELSEEKTLITHSNTYAKFLGYNIRVRRSNTVKPNGRGATQRTMSNGVELAIPLKEKINGFMFKNGIVKQCDNGELEPVCRNDMLRLTDLEIVSGWEAYIADDNGSQEVTVTSTSTKKILYVTLTNGSFDAVARANLNAEQLIIYNALNTTYGNRNYLWDVNNVTSGSGGNGMSYEIPPEALQDEEFARMIREAEKYLGVPYVWGGYSPSGFDCSGFVSYVINHCGNGWNYGRLTADGLRGVCTYVSPQEAKPGDLIFFQGTYNTSGASHVGIYVGNNMMIHCGDPIHYSNISTSYWQQHFMCCFNVIHRPVPPLPELLKGSDN